MDRLAVEPVLQIENLRVRYPGFRLDIAELQIPPGAYAVLTGATGCGKTTLLETVCGLRTANVDTIRIGGREVADIPAEQRGIGYVPQESILFPGWRVRDQLAFALQVRRMPSTLIKKRVLELAHQLRIEALLDRHPESLSGGERQKVALGRALAFSPLLLLLDEPLSAVDAESRDELLQQLQHVHGRGTTILHVTHDREETARLATLNLKIDNAGTLHTTPAE